MSSHVPSLPQPQMREGDPITLLRRIVCVGSNHLLFKWRVTILHRMPYKGYIGKNTCTHSGICPSCDTMLDKGYIDKYTCTYLYMIPLFDKFC